jgi:peptidoglycan/xylan/chitin deacetylase (PgdA/CDA1 family)
MIGVKTAVTRAAMSGLYHSGAHRLLAPYTQGAGVIFTLNHVRPPQAKAFAPNRDLEVSPDFLEAMLDQVEDAGLDVVSLDEVVRRLREDDARRFVCFTFDHGYRDVARHAYPLFQRRSLPLTLYIATDYASGWGELWWLALEEVIARAREIELCRHGELWRLPTATAQEKQRSFEQIYGWLRSIDEAMQRRVARGLADRYDIDMSAACHDLMMSWDEIRRLAADPLVVIGAHSKAHYAIAKLSPRRPFRSWRAAPM